MLFDKYDEIKMTNSDRRALAFDIVIIGLVLIALTSVLCGFLYNYTLKRDLEFFDEKTRDILNHIQAYMITATEDEYDELTEKLRNDMMRAHLVEEDKKYIDLVSNTSTHCVFDYIYDDQLVSGQPTLLYLNTGTFYKIGVNGEQPEEDCSGYIMMSSGYDEVSGSRHTCIHVPDHGYTTTTVTREDGEVSIQRVKDAFCDTCIDALLEAVANKTVAELVLVDPIQKKIYSLSEDQEYQIGSYTVSILRDSECYTIQARKQ